MKKFAVKDQVVLITTRHKKQHSNPVWGGEYGNVVGTVAINNRDSDESLQYEVAWDNGDSNVYAAKDLKSYKEIVMSIEPCTNSDCESYNGSKPTNCKGWDDHRFSGTLTIRKKCSDYKSEGTMISAAKNIASSVHETIKPYEKYIGLVALAAVIDHFFLDGKFTSRFKKLAEAVVDKITDGMDSITHRLTDGIIDEVDRDTISEADDIAEEPAVSEQEAK